MIAALLPLLTGVLDKVLPRVVADKDQVNAIKSEVTTLLIAQEGELRKAAADIVKTVVLEPTLQSVGVLGLLVVIRIFLGWSLIVEMEGRWPWQGKAEENPPES